jgi:hypothetical protein
VEGSKTTFRFSKHFNVYCPQIERSVQELVQVEGNVCLDPCLFRYDFCSVKCLKLFMEKYES